MTIPEPTQLDAPSSASTEIVPTAATVKPGDHVLVRCIVRTVHAHSGDPWMTLHPLRHNGSGEYVFAAPVSDAVFLDGLVWKPA